MSEVRIRPRQVLILIIVFLVVLMMVHRNGKRTCQDPEYLQAMFVQGDTNLLDRAGLEKRSTLLNIKTPSEFKLKGKDPNWIKPRGVEHRNLALSWLRSHVDVDRHSIVFFMDDEEHRKYRFSGLSCDSDYLARTLGLVIFRGINNIKVNNSFEGEQKGVLSE
ncbi:GD16798 [Drosophila simulans]|uniref:Galactosylgalactosylxylosylprotein 3-beta-glucuronosyltransferase n=1 Tax=Drosophila simulans TaxID=7240 RepID=B4R5L6_DROSI|nr:GD16798 [Drosophila simulans]